MLVRPATVARWHREGFRGFVARGGVRDDHESIDNGEPSETAPRVPPPHQDVQNTAMDSIAAGAFFSGWSMLEPSRFDMWLTRHVDRLTQFTEVSNFGDQNVSRAVN